MKKFFPYFYKNMSKEEIEKAVEIIINADYDKYERDYKIDYFRQEFDKYFQIHGKLMSKLNKILLKLNKPDIPSNEQASLKDEELKLRRIIWKTQEDFMPVYQADEKMFADYIGISLDIYIKAINKMNQDSNIRDEYNDFDESLQNYFDMVNKHKCWNCKKSGNNKCSRCKKVYYCSKECQKADWKKHKLDCK